MNKIVRTLRPFESTIFVLDYVYFVVMNDNGSPIVTTFRKADGLEVESREFESYYEHNEATFYFDTVDLCFLRITLNKSNERF